ncbi:hypothetical protein TGRUB_273320A, partial [Toxoplasma gondii RUB]
MKVLFFLGLLAG